MIDAPEPVSSPPVTAAAYATPPAPARALGGRTWLAMVAVGLVGQLAWVIENMYLNVFVYDTISTDPAVIAVMVAASAIAATAATLLIGAWSDRAGRRRAFISLGYIAWGACTAAFGFVGVPAGAEPIAGAAVMGAIVAIVVLDCVMSFFGSGANDASFNAWVTDSTNPGNRGRVDGVLSIFPLIAMLLVFGLLDGLTRAGDWKLFFGIVGGVTALTGVASWFLIRDRAIPASRDSVFAGVLNGLRPRTIRERPVLYLTLGIWAVVSTSVQVFLPYVIIYLQRYLRIESYALALGIVLILASVLSVIGGRVMDRIGKARFLAPAVVVFAAGLIAMTFARQMPVVIASATVMMAGMMASLATVSAMTRDYTPADRAGAVQGIRMILGVMVPMIVGPFLGAAVIAGAANTYTTLGVTQPVPGPEIFPTAAAVLILVPLFAWARARAIKRGLA
ncbi:MFS transporter [Microbacterium sp. STN6]|uniref:MFS transporter n=1 Tax=Microbacterium sp. STN6 TaxID=2995588 RepID=UPI002260E8B5|nr:MFS transporter [Microbacterium sp. STN6]MCX7521814.1 MFS transporter [Microbacterium sp. STN6]